jgi:gamma-glutamyltranspeptidase
MLSSMSLAVSVQQGHQTHISAIDPDVTLQSCDEKQFKVNMHDLQTYSAGFSPPSLTQFKRDDVVKLSEPSSVIKLLLQYMKPGPQPDLSKVDFEDLAGLAEAAQKYVVWSAIEVTKLQMQ